MELSLIYALWLREIKRFFRMKSRLLGSLGMPVFFLVFLGFAPIELPNAAGGSYMSFLAPGIVGMILLFASMGAGMSVLWDKQFGFLKEIMVAPVRRDTIVLGKTAGGVTTALVQGLLILILAVPLGLELTGIRSQLSVGGFSLGFLLSLGFMILIGFTFTGLGVAFASKMKDFQGFQLIWNFILFPVFLLSGALFPLDVFPQWLQYLTYLNPLTYGVDGLRGSLIGAASFPLWLDFTVLLASSVVMIFLAAYLFTKTEVD
jgi:ABC-2 type transport system permease protein